MSIDRNRFSDLLRALPTDQLIGLSGLAVLVSASFLSLVPTDDQTMVAALAAYLGGLGSNVLAELLQQGYQGLLSRPYSDEKERLVELAEALTIDIRKNAKLRHDLGKYLDSFEAFDIAQAIVAGNPSLHGWLLVQINQELVQFRHDFQFIHNRLDAIQGSLDLLTGVNSSHNARTEIPVPQNMTVGSKRTIKHILTLYPDILLKTFCPTGTFVSLPHITFSSSIEVEFVLVQLWSLITKIILVKVAELDSRVFDQSGSFSHEVNQAIQAANRWLAWINSNPIAFRSLVLTHTKTVKPQVASSLENRIKHNSVSMKIVVGRRNTLSEEQRFSLAGHNLSQPNIEIVSFDRLFDTARHLYRGTEASNST